MATKSDTKTEPRIPLSRERVLAAAVDLADEQGIEAVTMRRLGQRLGVEAMSLYNHVANKEDILNGMTDAIVDEINDQVSQIPGPADGGDWKTAMRTRILTARAVMVKHQWAPAIFETRTEMSPALFRYFDTLIGLFTEGGFSIDLTHHAMHALGSRALGFTQELFEDEEGELEPEEAAIMIQQMREPYPHITEMIIHVTHDDPDMLGMCDDQNEFEFGLDLILDGLDKHRSAS